jgi:ribosomal protein L29
MKSDKKQNLRKLDTSALNKRVEEITLELAKLKLDLKMGKLKNTSALGILRNEAAVIKTILQEKATSK